MGETGIKESSEMLSFVVGIAQACIHAAEDGQLSASDAMFFWNAIQKMPAAIKDASLIGEEMRNISADKVAQLAALAIVELKIANPKIDALVKQVIKVVFEGLKIGPLVFALKEAS